jgi:hypothetical protein
MRQEQASLHQNKKALEAKLDFQGWMNRSIKGS